MPSFFTFLHHWINVGPLRHGLVYLTLCLGILSPLQAEPPRLVDFAPPFLYAAAGGPYLLKLEDFNRDGILDIATPSRKSSLLVILPGLGNGNFGEDIQVGGEGTLGELGTGDFNGDGWLDLVASISRSNSISRVSVFLGNAGWQFSESFSANSSANSLSVADFNGDGHLDFAASEYTGTLSIFFGSGSGILFSAISNWVGDGVEVMAPGDFNGDGQMDLAFGKKYGTRTWNDGTRISIFLGRRDGKFSAGFDYDVGDVFATSLKAGDFDENGILDLAVSISHDGVARILIGVGDGSFVVSNSYAAGFYPYAMEQGDLNRDGHLDLICLTSGWAHVRLGQGDGTFGSGVYFPMGEQVQGLALGDLNHDGQLDIAAKGPNQVSLLLNRTLAGLDILRLPTATKVTWPAFITGFDLEWTSDVSSGHWTRQPGPFHMENNLYVLTNSLTGEDRFFRLNRMR